MLHPKRGGFWGGEGPWETFQFQEENSTAVPELVCIKWKSGSVAS